MSDFDDIQNAFMRDNLNKTMLKSYHIRLSWRFKLIRDLDLTIIWYWESKFGVGNLSE